MQIKAAIFDIGATLVTGPPVAPNKVIAALLVGVTAKEVASVIMNTDLTSAESVCSSLEHRFGRLNDAAINGITNLWNSQSSAAQALDGANEAVAALKSLGLKIGLLSDIWNPYYESVVKALPQVIENADSIILSCKTGVRKPCKDNFISSLTELNIEPSEAVMIGDTYTHDIHPALELGMHAIWVLARPDREIESVLQVINGQSPTPTATVSDIIEVAKLDLWTKDIVNNEVEG